MRRRKGDISNTILVVKKSNQVRCLFRLECWFSIDWMFHCRDYRLRFSSTAALTPCRHLGGMGVSALIAAYSIFIRRWFFPFKSMM
jgi:hypothetical protein